MIATWRCFRIEELAPLVSPNVTVAVDLMIRRDEAVVRDVEWQRLRVAAVIGAQDECWVGCLLRRWAEDKGRVFFVVADNMIWLGSVTGDSRFSEGYFQRGSGFRN